MRQADYRSRENARDSQRRRLEDASIFYAIQEESKNAPSLTLALQQRQDVRLAHGALDVADDRSRGVVEELHANLGDASARTGPAEHLHSAHISLCFLSQYPECATLTTRASLTGAFDESYAVIQHIICYFVYMQGLTIMTGSKGPAAAKRLSRSRGTVSKLAAGPDPNPK